jgi:hypothetical protein
MKQSTYSLILPSPASPQAIRDEKVPAFGINSPMKVETEEETI